MELREVSLPTGIELSLLFLSCFGRGMKELYYLDLYGIREQEKGQSRNTNPIPMKKSTSK